MVPDMFPVKDLDKVLTPALLIALPITFDSCPTRKITTRLPHAKNVSFNRLFAKFNKSFQVNHYFVHKCLQSPICHVVDIPAGF